MFNIVENTNNNNNHDEVDNSTGGYTGRNMIIEREVTFNIKGTSCLVRFNELIPILPP